MDTPSNIFAHYNVFECYLFSEDHTFTGLHLVWSINMSRYGCCGEMR